MVASVASSRSTISSVPIQPKSRAVTVASRYIPMLVGEVRCATTGLGIVLEVVGRQPVVLGADEGLEEAPRPAGDQAQRRDVAGGRAAPRPTRRRQADPAGDERREQPQADERRRDPGRASGLHGEDERPRATASTTPPAIRR